jgi:hypothetical protein
MRALNLRNSSNVSSAIYDEETGRLTVTFGHGRTYEYVVGADVIDGLEASASPGNYVRRLSGVRVG